MAAEQEHGPPAGEQRLSRRRLYSLMAAFAIIYFAQATSSPSLGLTNLTLQMYLLTAGYAVFLIEGLQAFTALGFYIKPLMGLLSDFIPVFGYRRKSYLIISGLIAAAVWGIVGSRPEWNIDHLAILLTVSLLGYAFVDVTCDGLMVETGQRTGMTGQLQSIQWLPYYVGLAVGAYFSGKLAGAEKYQESFLLSGGLCATTIIVAGLLTREERVPLDMESMRRTMRALGQAIRSDILWIVLLYVCFFFYNPLSDVVMTAYLTDPNLCGYTPEFLGKTGFVTWLAAPVGLLAYFFLCRRWRLRPLFVFAVLIGVVAGLGYLWVGAGHTAAYVVFGFAGLVLGFGVMPVFDLAARACPRGVEAFVFSLLMAATNVSGNMAQASGAKIYLAATSGANPLLSVEQATKLMIVAGACYTFMALPLMLLIPRRLLISGAEMAEQDWEAYAARAALGDERELRRRRAAGIIAMFGGLLLAIIAGAIASGALPVGPPLAQPIAALSIALWGFVAIGGCLVFHSSERALAEAKLSRVSVAGMIGATLLTAAAVAGALIMVVNFAVTVGPYVHTKPAELEQMVSEMGGTAAGATAFLLPLLVTIMRIGLALGVALGVAAVLSPVRWWTSEVEAKRAFAPLLVGLAIILIVAAILAWTMFGQPGTGPGAMS